ncbi:MAG: TIM-barrel domain-containing protein [Candidatus Cryptobacteroides sp.]
MIKKTFTAFLLCLVCATAGAADLQGNNPVADKAATVISGNARFTVLTPRLIRMEWSADARFEDRATMGIVNRALPVPAYHAKKKGEGVTITTESLKLTYSGKGKFNSDNLKVEFQMNDAKALKGTRKVTWTPGADDSGNLLGTTRTLDGCDGFTVKEPFDKGVLSRDGWAIIDESDRQVFIESNSDWKTWVEERDSTERLDLYIFAYGHDYKGALKDFTLVAGRIPLPPKYVFGYWWSRYWQYSDFEFIDLARTIRSLDIPMDVMVVDMDWHETFTLKKKGAPKDEFGQRIGWTGYTWQKQLFPNPETFLSELHSMDMKTSLNLHPASGIQPYEDCYENFVKDYLSRTSDYDGPEGYIYAEGGYQFKDTKAPVGKAGEKAPVPFRIDDMAWTDAYFNSVIHPLEEQGVDFWWLDWQQWKYSKYMPSLNNTFWLNRTFFDDKVRRSGSMGKKAERPLIYHRWGGIGSHRYQIGFSGDTYDTWDVLGYLPYFTSTASNVGYGYWGHDIGGHMQKSAHPTDPEMYTRWLQYGVFTPIFKTHSTKSSAIERRIWTFPDHFEAMREAIRLRYNLSPYIYNAARTTYDTGVSMCRPMYYGYPEDDRAYTYDRQHMFGDDILVAVIDSPADSVTALSERSIWFPEGCDWYDVSTGTIYEGGQETVLRYTINENPYFIKAGAVIPMASPEIRSLQQHSNEIRFFVAPGGKDYETDLYEDDGHSQAYTEDFCITHLKKTCGKGSVTLTVSPREGSYEGADETRRIMVTFDGILPPEEIRVNGKPLPYARFAEDGQWKYDGRELAAIVFIPEMLASEEVIVECICKEGNDRNLLDGKKGLLKRMAAITPEVKLVYGSKVDSYVLLPTDFLKVAQCSSYITENPSSAADYLNGIDLEKMYSTFDATDKLPESFKKKIKAQSSVILR